MSTSCCGNARLATPLARSGLGGALERGRLGSDAAARQCGERRRRGLAHALAEVGHDEPEGDRGQHHHEDSQLDLLGPVPGLVQHAVLAGPVPEQDPARSGGAGGETIKKEELPVRHAGRACDEVGDGANSGKEPRDHDEFRAVPVEEANDPRDLLPRNVATEAGIEERFAVRRTSAEDDGVADQDSGETDEDHPPDRADADGRTLAREISARDERHVLRKGQSQTAGDEDGEDAYIAGDTVELQEEVVELLMQSRLPVRPMKSLWRDLVAAIGPTSESTRAFPKEQGTSGGLSFLEISSDADPTHAPPAACPPARRGTRGAVPWRRGRARRSPWRAPEGASGSLAVSVCGDFRTPSA